MDLRSILQDQIEELQRRLARIKEAITSPETAPVGIDERLLARVRLRFERRILDQERALEYARRGIVDKTRDLAECWDLFRPVRKACQPLLEESLAVLEGALARSARLDDGFCDIADRLIAEIGALAENEWNRFTILSEGELYTNVADVIRLRFPFAGIWDLPIAAHEYGHFVSKRLSEEVPGGTTRHPFQDFLNIKSPERNSRLWHHLNEFFADAFASFTMGPAFAQTALRLRFDASRPDEEDDTHPSPAKRAHLILQTLRWMDQKSPFAPFAVSIDGMQRLWPKPDSDTRLTIDGYLDDWLEPMLEKNVPLARYQISSPPYGIATKLRQQQEPEAGHSLRDVLNAAWIARLQPPDCRATVEQTATAWFVGSPTGQSLRMVANA